MKLIKFLVAIAFGCVVAQSAFSRSPEWPSALFKVKILSDGYEDLVKRWGTPKDGTAEPERIEDFRLAGGEVRVLFTNSRCEPSVGDFEKRGWNLPERRVESMLFNWGYTDTGAPFSPYTFKERNIDLTEFESGKTEFGSAWFHNTRTGIGYRDWKGLLVDIHFYPSDEQVETLRCEPIK